MMAWVFWLQRASGIIIKVLKSSPITVILAHSGTLQWRTCASWGTRESNEFPELHEWITNDSLQIRVIREIRGCSFDDH